MELKYREQIGDKYLYDIIRFGQPVDQIVARNKKEAKIKFREWQLIHIYRK